jgi:hypothetical protein
MGLLKHLTQNMTSEAPATARQPIGVWGVAMGVFLGQILTAILGGLLYALLKS